MLVYWVAEVQGEMDRLSADRQVHRKGEPRELC